ncbi:hypothetical protein APHAL10511_005929 [Amanita phalloides]|nr:hypothetical protein APHAL10511_005929 [Amanita phalloides]
MALASDSHRFSSLFFPASSTEPKKRPPHYRPVSSILHSRAQQHQLPASQPHHRPRLSLDSEPSPQMKEKSRVSFDSLSKHRATRSKSPPPFSVGDRIFSRNNIFSKLTRKCSMSSLNSVTYNVQHPNDVTTPQPLATNLSSPSLRKQATKRDNWIRKQYATLHPYPEEAPYMQAYDPILLDNDRYTDLLLRRLMPSGSPTFHDYGTKPPLSVLDLGCGLGHWVLYAADIWKTSQFIGFDLVDLTSHIEKPENVTFVKGNFLKQRLPFANKQFDLVRMANLALCIPQAKWEALLSEVFRILAVGGRLELIDDEIFFPYGPTPASDSKQAKPVVQSVFDEFDDDDDTLEDGSGDPDSTLVDGRDISTDKSIEIDLRKPNRQSTGSSSTDDSFLRSPTLADVPIDEITTSWPQQASECRDLEKVFEQMLRMNYDIDPRPSDFLSNIILLVFGKSNIQRQRTFHLKLAPKSADEFYGLSANSGSKEMLGDKGDDWSTHSSDSGLGLPPLKKSFTLEREKGQDIGSISDTVSAKAAGRLGITYSALAAATAATVRQRTLTSPTQSPGIILWPSTYFPMSPSELEMHACKYLHVLLGCKNALQEYMKSFIEKDGKKWIEDGVCSDMLWEYECFRRRRFHWPADVPDIRLEMRQPPDTSATFKGIQCRNSFSGTKQLASAESTICPYTEDELTHIRTIRVFQAMKSDEYSLANLEYPRYPVPLPPPNRFRF